MSFQDEMRKMFLRVAEGAVEPAEWEQWWNSNQSRLEEFRRQTALERQK